VSEVIINIDGRDCSCVKGEYLLDVAKRNGIYIPTFCHNEGLRGRASCRVCIVETESGGRRDVVTACIFPVEHEMNVYTNSEKIKKQRRMILTLLSARAPEADNVAMMLGQAGGAVPERFIRLKGEKCIMCGLCAQACESVGAGAIATVSRGTDKKVSTPYDEAPERCIGCAGCAAVCPTDVIGVSEDENTRTIWNKTFTLIKCEKCGKTVGTREEIAFAAEKAGMEPAKLCGECRKKAMADVFAKAFGN
jgi:NADH dehydrogenase/NADH:ubiquinone oxidoreductase subunit G